MTLSQAACAARKPGKTAKKTAKSAPFALPPSVADSPRGLPVPCVDRQPAWLARSASATRFTARAFASSPTLRTHSHARGSDSMPKRRRRARPAAPARPATAQGAQHDAAAAIAAAYAAVAGLQGAADVAARARDAELSSALLVAAERIEHGINAALDGLDGLLTVLQSPRNPRSLT